MSGEGRAGIFTALEHLGQRVPTLAATESRNRHWTVADLEAVALLIDSPASREQIALARIEGVATNGGFGDMKHIRQIARRALGLPVSA
jgi:hypothetical protein